MKTASEKTGPLKKGLNWGTAIFLIISHVAAIGALFFWSWPALITASNTLLGCRHAWRRHGLSPPDHSPRRIRFRSQSNISWSPVQRCRSKAARFSGSRRIAFIMLIRIAQATLTHRATAAGGHMSVGFSRGAAQDHDQATLARYAPDMIKDRYYVWLTKYYYVPLIVVGLGLLAFGGFGVMLWGVFLRVTLGLHATWLVNSATHMWGRQRFETGEDSRNSWWVALLTFGEGWHNNHHAHPTSAQHGLKWYEIDFNWWGIRALQFLGLARRIKRVRFNSTATMWQLVTGDKKRKPSYERI